MSAFPGASSEISDLLDRFEEAWQSGAPPRLEQFLPGAADGKGDAAAGRQVLAELVKIDLDNRWRRATVAATVGPAPALQDTLPERPYLDDYLERFPGLGPREQLPLDLIQEEYRARHCWGDRPGHAEYSARFAAHGPALEQALAQVDSQLAEEFARNRAAKTPVPEALPLAIPTVATLLEALRNLGLLKQTRLNELLQHEAQNHFADATALCQHLLERDWLTRYQTNQLLQARAQDLVLGPYVILDQIAEGASSRVFKARHRALDRTVALKVIRPEIFADTDADTISRFYREVQAAGRLSHPHVVHAFDAGPAGATHYLAMEWVEGVNLQQLAQKSGPLPVAQACEYVRQATLGLQHAFENGLVHRDVKPSNLMVVASGKGLVTSEEKIASASSLATSHQPLATVKILDLGLARLHLSGQDRRASTLTRQGDLMGTADYMAPEQADDPHSVDIRADLYSLGCTFYFLLCGRPPFPEGTFIQKLEKHRWQEATPVEEVRADVPPAVAAVVHKLMAKAPEERYQTPMELLAALATDAPPPEPAKAAAPRPGRRSLMIPLLAGGITVLLLATFVGFVLLGEPRKATSRSSFALPAPTKAKTQATEPGKTNEFVAIVSPSLRPFELGIADIGAKYYLDRDYIVTNLGPALRGGVLIRTANNDKAQTGADYLTFKLDAPAMVYVAYSGRATALPEWLKSGWKLTTEKFETNDGNPTSRVYARHFQAGNITLGGNLQPPAQGPDSNYVVIVKRS
jgi:serine/threonine-protein kinase